MNGWPAKTREPKRHRLDNMLQMERIPHFASLLERALEQSATATW